MAPPESSPRTSVRQSAHGVPRASGGGDAEDPRGVVIPEHDPAGRIDDRKTGAELFQKLEIFSGQGLYQVLSSRARLSLRAQIGASAAPPIVAPGGVRSVGIEGPYRR